jgi:hypothetical protein
MKPPADRVLDWLLEKSDPGVRYFALRDLLGAPADDADVVAARHATVRASPVREILQAQDTEGWWCKPGPGYSPKYQGTVWSVIFLGQFGADGSNRRVRKAAEYVLDHTRAPEPYGGFSANGTPAAMVHCLEGNLCASLLELGWGQDPRLRLALEWLARSIVGERIQPAVALGQRTRKAGPSDLPRFYRSGNSGPGFLCSANNHRACAWGAIPAMDALSRVPPRERTKVMRRAIDTGAEFLLGVDPAQAGYPTPYAGKPNGSWFRFGYPLGYVQDVLHNAEVLTALGHGRDRRLGGVVDLILSKRDDSGRWPAEYSYNGKMWADVEEKRKPSKWVTLRARRVFHRMGVTV